MRKILVILIMSCGLLGVVTKEAKATDTIGPICFSVSPFTDQFVFFFDFHGGNQFDVTGRDLVTGSAVSASAFITGNTLVLSFIAGQNPSSTGSHPFFGTGNISLSTFSGPGRCDTINTSAGCGTGTSFTYALISCPSGATAAPFPAPINGPRMDGSE